MLFQSMPTAGEVVSGGGALDDALKAHGLDSMTPETAPTGPFFYAEIYHQQYLVKNPSGYCLGRGGVACPIGLGGEVVH